MTAPVRLPHWCDAIRFRDFGWSAMFITPGHGARILKHDDGRPRIFRTREAAKAAASDAMCEALDGEKAKPALGKRNFRVLGAGKARFTREIGAR